MKNTNKIPSLRFSKFSEEWKISEFVDLVKKSSQKYNPDTDKNIHQCVELESLSQKTGILLETFNSNELKSIKTKFYTGDVLFGKLRPYLKKFLRANFDGVCSSEIWVFSGIKLQNDFLYYLIQTNKFNYVANVSSGSKMPRSDWEYISSIPFFYPSIKEQKNIADFIFQIDNKIEKLTKKKELLEKYKKGVMQKIFNQEVRFKNDNGEDYPEWKIKKLEEIGVFKSGCGFPESEQNGKEGIPFYKVSDMNLKLNFSEMIEANNYVSLEQINNMKFKVISEYAIIFAKVGAAIFLERKRKAQNFLIDNNMMAFIPKKENIDFIKYFFDTIFLSKYAQVGALPSYNSSDLQKIKIYVPSLEEQTKIAYFLTEIDKKINLTEKQLNGTKQYKKGLLQQMFI